MKRVYILGAGPTGLALAQQLAETAPDLSVIVVERSQSLGGLAQTLEWPGRGFHDLGPHKIFTLDQKLWQKVRGLLPASDWLTRPKNSRIYLGGTFLPYPPSPFALAKVFGPVAFVRMVYGFAKSRLLRREGLPTFEGDLQARVGDALYEILFLPIAQKLWGDPATLDEKLSQGRVQTPALSEVILRTLRIRRTSAFEALKFDYPRNGLSRLWDSIRLRCGEKIEFRTNTEVRFIEFDQGRVRRLATKSKTGDDVIEIDSGDFIFSTLPIMRLLDSCRGVPGKIVTLARETVLLNDLILVFVNLDVNELFADSWIFVPDPKVSFHRISEQKSFDPGMTPHGTIVCCELMSNPTRNLASWTDSALEQLVVEDLRAMAGKPFGVEAIKIIRLPASYPVYRTGFTPKLKQVLDHLDSIENFRSIGRAGAFNYIGTLDCMDIGYGAGRWFLSDYSRGKAETWRAERLRTSHYPVLD